LSLYLSTFSCGGQRGIKWGGNMQWYVDTRPKRGGRSTPFNRAEKASRIICFQYVGFTRFRGIAEDSRTWGSTF
jgi:hypothetical protein